MENNPSGLASYPEGVDVAENLFSEAKIIVAKSGTSSLCREGKLDEGRIRQRARDIARQMEGGKGVVYVSSGAILAAMSKYGITDKAAYRSNFASDDAYYQSLQRLSGEGQPLLMEAYNSVFPQMGIRTAQVLVTKDDIRYYERFYGNLLGLFRRYTDQKKPCQEKVEVLADMIGFAEAEMRGNGYDHGFVDIIKGYLKDGVLPIINENDALKNDEITFGDNDKLSAYVCNAIGGDALVMLSDNELHDRNPAIEGARKVDVVRFREIEGYKSAANGKGAWGLGGMISKLEAAEMVGMCGTPSAIVKSNGSYDAMPISDTMSGSYRGTLILPRGYGGL
jgi:glutamate 5-kinase